MATRKARECWVWFHSKTDTVCDASSNRNKIIKCDAPRGYSGYPVRVLMREVRKPKRKRTEPKGYDKLMLRQLKAL